MNRSVIEMTKADVIEMMASSKSAREWNANADAVKELHDGRYPDYWFTTFMLSDGLFDRLSKQWRRPMPGFRVGLSIVGLVTAGLLVSAFLPVKPIAAYSTPRPTVHRVEAVAMAEATQALVTWVVVYPAQAMSDERSHDQARSFMVQRGTFILIRDGQTQQVLGQGQIVSVPAGVKHLWINRTGASAVLLAYGVADSSHDDVCGGAY